MSKTPAPPTDALFTTLPSTVNAPLDDADAATRKSPVFVILDNFTVLPSMRILLLSVLETSPPTNAPGAAIVAFAFAPSPEIAPVVILCPRMSNVPVLRIDVDVKLPALFNVSPAILSCGKTDSLEIAPNDISPCVVSIFAIPCFSKISPAICKEPVFNVNLPLSVMLFQSIFWAILVSPEIFATNTPLLTMEALFGLPPLMVKLSPLIFIVPDVFSFVIAPATVIFLADTVTVPAALFSKLPVIPVSVVSSKSPPAVIFNEPARF